MTKKINGEYHEYVWVLFCHTDGGVQEVHYTKESAREAMMEIAKSYLDCDEDNPPCPFAPSPIVNMLKESKGEVAKSCFDDVKGLKGNLEMKWEESNGEDIECTITNTKTKEDICYMSAYEVPMLGWEGKDK